MASRILSVTDGSLLDFEGELSHLPDALPRRVDADPDKVEQGLAKLVLTLIELLRGLMEKQALRRVEGGALTPEEIERIGLTFMRLERKMAELRDLFGLTPEDLALSLGSVDGLGN